MLSFESWPTFYPALTFVEFLRLEVIFSETIRVEPWNLGHAYILKSQGQPYFKFWVLTYFLQCTDFCRVFAFRSFSQKL